MAREAETLPAREVTSNGGNGRKRAYEGRSDGRICLRRNVRGPCELLLLLWLLVPLRECVCMRLQV